MTTLSVIHPISVTLSGACRRFTLHAIEAESKHSNAKSMSDRDREGALAVVMQYASGAVILAVADVESMINEIFQGADDYLRRMSPEVIQANTTMPRNLTKSAAICWRETWAENQLRGLTALQKIQKALELAELEPTPSGEGPGQHLAALIRLRRELVHNVPTPRRHGGPMNKRDDLEQTLAGKFEPSTITPETYSFFWYRCLSAGCARWAYLTATNIKNEFFHKLGIPIAAEPNLPEDRA